MNTSKVTEEEMDNLVYLNSIKTKEAVSDRATLKTSLAPNGIKKLWLFFLLQILLFLIVSQHIQTS